MSNVPRSMDDVDPLPVLGPRPVPTVDVPLQLDYWLQLPGGFSVNRQGQRAYTPRDGSAPTDVDNPMIRRDRATIERDRVAAYERAWTDLGCAK